MRTINRRNAIVGGFALAAAGSFPALAALPAVRPRSRVIIDNDFAGDPDGLFQLAHHLASPATEIPLVIGSHLHPGEDRDHGGTQAANAARRAGEVIARMRLARRPTVIAGRDAAPAADARAEPTPAVRAIVAEALRTDTRLPLFYVAGAGLTDLAEAIRVEPRIADRMTLVWIGGSEYAALHPTLPVHDDPEYNLTIDIAAARAVFGASRIPIWQVPRDTYRAMIVSYAELEAGLRPAGQLGVYLLDRLAAIVAAVPIPLGETYILGDSPLVTLTALQTSFAPDTASSDYVIMPTPRIGATGLYEPAPDGRPMRVYTRIDARLTFADMFAKFAACSI